MSVLTFRGVPYERGTLSFGPESPAQELVYRSPSQGKRVIRSSPIGALLQSEGPNDLTNRVVYRGVALRHRKAQRRERGPIQRGGFIRSRMTAELLGINPVKAVGAPVRPNGIVCSRATADLLKFDCTRVRSSLMYRGVAY